MSEITTEFMIEKNGHKVFCSVSPCSWMYKGYGLQVQLSLSEHGCNAESMFFNDKTVEINREMPVAEIVSKGMALANASVDIPALIKAKEDWAAVAAKYRAQAKLRAEKEAKAEQDLKAKGYTHKFVGWVHPNSGDDRKVVAYVKGETLLPHDVKKLLRGCTVKTDYVFGPF